jgi:hypothetical protein
VRALLAAAAAIGGNAFPRGISPVALGARPDALVRRHTPVLSRRDDRGLEPEHAHVAEQAIDRILGSVWLGG